LARVDDRFYQQLCCLQISRRVKIPSVKSEIRQALLCQSSSGPNN
jgi:hypothetical protein